MGAGPMGDRVVLIGGARKTAVGTGEGSRQTAPPPTLSLPQTRTLGDTGGDAEVLA